PQPTMGKKKKGGGKKSKKSSRAQSGATGQAGAGAKLAPALPDKREQEAKLRQLKDLQRRVSGLQRRCDELELLNDQLKSKRVTVSGDMEEITEYLRDRVSEKTNTCAELQEELRALQEAYEKDQKSYEERMEKQKKEFRDTKEQLEQDGFTLQSKLTTLDEYRIQKEEMHEKFQEMDEKMKRQEEIHKEEIYLLERETVVQKDSLRKEMVEKVNDVASEFRKVSNRQMAETTRKTIEENAALNRQLGSLSEKITGLIEENDKVKAKEKEQQREIEVLESIEKEMLAKTANSLKTIRSLADACRDRDTQLIDMEERAEAGDSVQSEHSLLGAQAESQSQELVAMRTETSNQLTELDRLAELARQTARIHRRFQRLLRQSERAVSDAFSTLTPDEEMTEAEAVILRRKMLVSLLELLHMAARVGLGPEPASLGRAGQPGTVERKPLRASSASGGAPSSAGKRGSGGGLVSERLSELGLAPAAAATKRSGGGGGGVSSRTEFVAEKLATQLPPGGLLEPLILRRGRPVPAGIF
ncbi:hypothetical protein BOX15_Mlig022018g1, partial [Macrostomum lignano]